MIYQMRPLSDPACSMLLVLYACSYDISAILGLAIGDSGPYSLAVGIHAYCPPTGDRIDFEVVDDSWCVDWRAVAVSRIGKADCEKNQGCYR
jgi:hypothetical protein